jgi:SagB-type dehydrogenase family enzyme
MANQEINVAWEYHDRTRHSPESVRTSAHFLDWENQPLPFKIYRNLEPIPLPFERGRASMPALVAMSRRGTRPAPDVRDLATLLYFAAGITRKRRHVMFRAASNTGALYEIELYVICGDLDGLAAGVYHFSPLDQALRRLRAGDFRAVLGSGAAPAVIVSTGTYWRNAWKYRARAYRHFGWDNGTLLANLLATAGALDLPARLLCGFVDADVNQLLGVDTHREVAFSLVAVGQAGTPPAPPEVPEIELQTEPLSAREVDYPLMREMHTASSLMSAEEVAAWRDEPKPSRMLEPGALPGDSIEAVILRRGSSRRFDRAPIPSTAFAAILERSCCGLDADFASPLNEVYVVVNAVEGMEPGAYFYDGELRALRRGDFRREAAFLALEQELAGDAAADVFFVADLNRCLERYGNRGYRAVQLEAGILGGRVYLGAYAFQLGATGLTFYDDEVIRFLSPHAAGKSAIFLVAVGRPGRVK